MTDTAPRQPDIEGATDDAADRGQISEVLSEAGGIMRGTKLLDIETVRIPNSLRTDQSPSTSNGLAADTAAQRSAVTHAPCAPDAPPLAEQIEDALAPYMRQAAMKVAQLSGARDWVDEYFVGEALTTGMAAEILGVTDDTIRKWCEECWAVGKPIGVPTWTSGDRVIWLVSLRRLLDEIPYRKRNDGAALRAEAELRAKQMTPKFGSFKKTPTESTGNSA